MSTVTFTDARVRNDAGIDITQGMIDNVANPFLDLDAIVTQFKFNDTSATVKIPAGTTVKYGEDQCTLLEDVTATLTPDLSEDCHATTTSGTVLSGTTLDSGQLITTAGQWAVVLNSSVKVKTQDGYAILGTKDPNTLSGGTEVSLSEGTNVYATSEIHVTKVNEETAQFHFLADVTYHQIVLQELYDTLVALQDIRGKANLLAYLKSCCMGTDRNELSQDEYDKLQNKSLAEIKEYLYGLNWFSKEDLSGLSDLDDLVEFVKGENTSSFELSDIISIYDSYGSFSDVEIQNLRNGENLDGSTRIDDLTVGNLLDLHDGLAFSNTEIDAIRLSAAQEFLKSLKDVPNIAINDVLRALGDSYNCDGEVQIDDICNNLAAIVGEDDFTLDEFDSFLKALLGTKVSNEEICQLPEFVDGAYCVQLSNASNTFFNQLSSNSSAITASYLSTVFGTTTTLQSLQDDVLKGDKTIQSIYIKIKENIPSSLKEDDGTIMDDATWPPSGITSPNDAASLDATQVVNDYFAELTKHTEGANQLVTLDDLKSTCNKLGVTTGDAVDKCIANLKNAVIGLDCTPTDINNDLAAIIISRWQSSTSQIKLEDSTIKHIIENGQISLSELKKAVKNMGIDNNVNSETEIIEILSRYELKLCDLVTGLTKAHKYDNDLFADELASAISDQDKLNGYTLFKYQRATSVFDKNGNIETFAYEKILELLKDETRIDYDGFKSGLLSLSRFTETKVNDAITSDIGDVYSFQEYNDNMNKLLNLCLLAGTPPDGQSSYALATGVERTVDSNGNYVYKIVGSGTIQAGEVDASFSKEDATTGMAMAYYALAIMYEKTCIQQMILVEQLKQIEKINDEIRENNRALKALTDLYDKVYTVVTWSANAGDLNKYNNLSYSVSLDNSEMSVSKLNEYLKSTVQNGEGLGPTGDISSFNGVNAQSYRVNGNQFMTVVGRYDRDGNNMWDRYQAVQEDEKDAEKDFDSNTSNIDVKEQATLTHISNLQDQVRMYGDSLSTDAQLMTTKMEQYMQDANACVQACTQTVKSIGDYWKNIITNIR